MPRGEHAPPAPGVVKVRLQGDSDSAGALVRILREHAEILTGPDSYPGGREYLLVRVREDGPPGGAVGFPAPGGTESAAVNPPRVNLTGAR